MSGRAELLRLLSDGALHSGEELAAALSISRAAVWKRLQQLEAWGIACEARPGSSAMTFSVLRVSLMVSMSIATDVPASCGPRANVVSSTGIATGPPRVPAMRPSRSGSAPSL